MRGVIIGGGKIRDYEYIRSFISEEDFIICADGGYNHAKNMNIKPDILIGDMDSVTDFMHDAEVLKYPADKDFTDGELCIKYAKEKGIDELLLVGMTSERLDHTINNILMMASFPKAKIVDENNEIYILKDNLTIIGKKGKTLSIIPVSGDLEGISTKGLLYSLNKENLFFASCRGNSNVITDDKCEITAQKGMAIVIVVR